MNNAVNKIKALLAAEEAEIKHHLGSVTIDWRLAEAEIKADCYKKCLEILEAADAPKP